MSSVHSSSEPVHQWMLSGWVSSATSLTKSRMPWWVVGAWRFGGHAWGFPLAHSRGRLAARRRPPGRRAYRRMCRGVVCGSHGFVVGDFCDARDVLAAVLLGSGAPGWPEATPGREGRLLDRSMPDAGPTCEFHAPGRSVTSRQASRFDSCVRWITWRSTSAGRTASSTRRSGVSTRSTPPTPAAVLAARSQRAPRGPVEAERRRPVAVAGGEPGSGVGRGWRRPAPRAARRCGSLPASRLGGGSARIPASRRRPRRPTRPGARRPGCRRRSVAGGRPGRPGASALVGVVDEGWVESWQPSSAAARRTAAAVRRARESGRGML